MKLFAVLLFAAASVALGQTPAAQKPDGLITQWMTKATCERLAISLPGFQACRPTITLIAYGVPAGSAVRFEASYTDLTGAVKIISHTSDSDAGYAVYVFVVDGDFITIVKSSATLLLEAGTETKLHV